MSNRTLHIRPSLLHSRDANLELAKASSKKTGSAKKVGSAKAKAKSPAKSKLKKSTAAEARNKKHNEFLRAGIALGRKAAIAYHDSKTLHDSPAENMSHAERRKAHKDMNNRLVKLGREIDSIEGPGASTILVAAINTFCTKLSQHNPLKKHDSGKKGKIPPATTLALMLKNKAGCSRANRQNHLIAASKAKIEHDLARDAHIVEGSLREASLPEDKNKKYFEESVGSILNSAGGSGLASAANENEAGQAAADVAAKVYSHGGSVDEAIKEQIKEDLTGIPDAKHSATVTHLRAVEKFGNTVYRHPEGKKIIDAFYEDVKANSSTLPIPANFHTLSNEDKSSVISRTFNHIGRTVFRASVKLKKGLMDLGSKIMSGVRAFGRGVKEVFRASLEAFVDYVTNPFFYIFDVLPRLGRQGDKAKGVTGSDNPPVSTYNPSSDVADSVGSSGTSLAEASSGGEWLEGVSDVVNVGIDGAGKVAGAVVEGVVAGAEAVVEGVVAGAEAVVEGVASAA